MALVPELLVLDRHAVDLGYAEIAGARAKVGRKVVEFGANAPGREAELAARSEQHERPSLEDRLERPVAARQVEGEGLVDADDLIDPGLQSSRHSIVVHGGRDKQQVGPPELVDELVGNGKQVPLPAGPLRARGEGGGDPLLGHRRRRRKAYVAAEDPVAVPAQSPFVDELVSEGA